MVDKHYTGHQVADLLGVDYETVLGLAQAGELASVRVGRLRRFPESGVKRFLDRCRDDTGVVVDLHRRLPSPRRKEPDVDS